MNLGNAHDPFSIGTIIDALNGLKETKNNKAQETGEETKGKQVSTPPTPPPPPIVSVSVEYRLSPENPFPAAVIDALSVVTAILEENPDRQIHLAGTSAGGNLAVVCAMELHRRMPGRIKSVISFAPMFDPAADSLSYHLNSLSSRLCPVDYLRWSWRVYLDTYQGMKEDEIPIIANEPSETKLLSNQTLWNNSPWKKNMATRRLIEPYVDLPKGLDDPKVAPKFIVATNRGDPLMDDGTKLITALRATDASNVIHIDASGSHVFGFQFDTETRTSMQQELATTLFGLGEDE